MSAQERYSDELMSSEGVVGTAVGLDGNRPVMLVLVTNGGVAVPGRLGGVNVRPLVTGEIRALQQVDPRGKPKCHPKRGCDDPPPDDPPDDPPPVSPTDRARPAFLGMSTGHFDITAGTIGALVTDGILFYLLSNNHVYANENAAALGDNVLQPGPFDGGTDPDYAIGTLSAFVPISFGGADNAVDAAIAEVKPADVDNQTIPGLSRSYGTPSSTTVAARLRMNVFKCGRTTACTKGRAQGINATVNVGYDAGVARFVGQIVIGGGGFSAGGDSGSLVVDGQNRPVGLLYAGGGSTIANPIDDVLAAFGVTVVGN